MCAAAMLGFISLPMLSIPSCHLIHKMLFYSRKFKESMTKPNPAALLVAATPPPQPYPGPLQPQQPSQFKRPARTLATPDRLSATTTPSSRHSCTRCAPTCSTHM